MSGAKFAVRTAEQICADTPERDAQLIEQLHKGEHTPDLLAHLEHESTLGEIADTKNCDLEAVRDWERGTVENARRYAEDMIAAAVVQGLTSVPKLEIVRRSKIIEAVEFAGGYEEAAQSWLIDSLLPARGVGMVWGASGSHKTGVVLDMLAAVHSGAEKWRDKAVTRGRGVLVLGEGQFFFRNRMRAYSKLHNVAMASMPAVVASPVNLRDATHVAIFAHEALKLGASQIWFDTLQQNSPGSDGNSDKEMGEIVANLKWLSDKLGCFVGVLHHEGKGGHERGPRGSSVWRPALDVELYVESADGVHGTVYAEKIKDGPSGALYPFKREVVFLDRYENERPVTSIAIVQVDGELGKEAFRQSMTALQRAMVERVRTVAEPETDGLASAAQIFDGMSGRPKDLKKRLDSLVARGCLMVESDKYRVPPPVVADDTGAGF